MARTKPPLSQGVPIPIGEDDRDTGSHIATPPQEYTLPDEEEADEQRREVEVEVENGAETVDNDDEPEVNGGPRREGEDEPSKGEQVVEEIVAEADSAEPVGLGIRHDSQDEGHEQDAEGQQAQEGNKIDAGREISSTPTPNINITMTGAPEDPVEEGEGEGEREGATSRSSTPSSPRPGEEELPDRPQAPTPLHASETVRRTLPSITLITQALETIAASKEARKRQQLSESAKKALEAIKATEPDAPDPEIIFEPFNLACQVHNANLTVTSLDSIDKLISYGYFTSDAPPPSPPPAPQSEEGDDAEGEEGEKKERPPPPPAPKQKAPLIERAIETVSGCFIGESTDDRVQMQIIKALLSAVLNDKFVVHGAGLLKAVRQTYNIFLLSRSSQNQTVAQGALTQMVHMVFERVKTRIQAKEARLNLSGMHHNYSTSTTTIHAAQSTTTDNDGDVDSDAPPSGDNSSDTPPPQPEKITLQSFENRKSFDDERITDNAPTVVTVDVPRPSSSRPTTAGSGSVQNQANEHRGSVASTDQEVEDEVFIKDAFLVFRAMCKLSIKILPPDQASDLKSHGMRSKLLALHLIHTILKNHGLLFTNPLVTIRGSGSTDAPTEFVLATKQYLCLSLSRNASSPVPWVFAVCSEIFWLMIRDMRGALKKEIEVFMKEIYIAILDNKNSSVQQKQSILMLFERLSHDPKALVEIYLNYDCDRNALDNMFQRIIEHLSKISASPVHLTTLQQHNYDEVHPTRAASAAYSTFALPSSLATAAVASAPLPGQETAGLYPVEYLLKRHSLENIVDLLRSLVAWSQRGMEQSIGRDPSRESLGDRDSVDYPRSKSVSQSITPNAAPSTPQHELDRKPGSPDVAWATDDPSQFEKVKLRKSALTEAIRKFNFKPKRGIKALIDGGFITDDSPEKIAEFLLTNETLDKAMIGEYLGEGDEVNVKIMHAFVDQMDFTRSRFVDALRRFLQGFRLPGEAQKIDRFMLKFAERYISGNPNAFANADTAYVLAYSVIMLNTDQHSAQVKKRMSKEEFIKNNRGINDNADLPDDYLGGIFDEIRTNEIILDTEKAAIVSLAQQQQGTGLAAGIGQALATVGRDLQREAYVQASEEMANKTEQLFKTLMRAQKKSSTKISASSKFVYASSFRHVGPMFEVVWMSLLSGLSEPTQESSDLDTIRLCMEGFKLAIRVACMFDLELPRISFVGALTKFTQLNNLSEMKPKNVEALKVLLDVAQSEGNQLKTSWKDVLMCVSQLERFQLLSQGVDEGSLPDVSRNRVLQQDDRRASMQSTRSGRSNRGKHHSTFFQQDVAEESRSREVVIAIDKIFANTAQLNGDAIVHFVRALSEVSWQEVQSSGQSESPRVFSLQKLVEISYYNMNRIRFEWSNLWAILGEHFNQVGCLSNTSIVFFALDSLRQLSMRFLEIEELPHFQFQKDFLKPFEHVMANSSHAKVKDMVLQCLNQMLQARGDNIKSGWRTMFGTYSFAAREQYDSIVDYSFKTVQKIFTERFGIIVNQGSFTDLVVCLTEFAKNLRFQIVSLQAIDLLKNTVPKMLNCPQCPLCPRHVDYPGSSRKEEDVFGGGKVRTAGKDPMVTYWFPVLFSFHDILMSGDDLEVRSRALSYLFEILTRYGKDYPPAFWDTVCRQILFPIFMVLKSRSEMSRFQNHEDMTVWLSTTMIQALRNLIALFTHFFDQLERFLDGFLELLITCICQENDTIARIGSSCLQQLILQNVHKWQDDHWKKLVNAFVNLFETTTAHQLFSATTPGAINAPPSPSKGTFDEEDGVMPSSENSLKINGLEHKISQISEGITPTEPQSEEGDDQHQIEDFKPAGQPQAAPVVTAARRRFFNKIITKCVLQLLMIETVSELFSNDAVYSEIPSAELLRLMSLLKKSFTFARKFNNDKDLRMRLFREGFMKQPPNLLKQESGSAATYVSILFRMHRDEDTERKKSRADVEEALIPLCVDIISGYVELDSETQQRNIVAWRPVVVEVLEGYNGFSTTDFSRYIETFYSVIIELLNRELGVEVRNAVRAFLKRVGEVRLNIKPDATGESRLGRRRGSVMSRSK